MSGIRNFLRHGGLATVVAILAGTATALAYATGEQYLKTSPSYQVGYAAGAVDMLAGLHELRLVKDGSFAADTDKVLNCISAKKLKPSDLVKVYTAYLQQNPRQQSDPAAGDIFVSLKSACSG